MTTPKLMVMAGPNGSGKSTITSQISVIGYYINADDIKKEKVCSDLEAAQLATATREYMVDNGLDFTFESVLSTPRNYELMERAKKNNYKIICIYVLTTNPEINVKRVASRVKKGGHSVKPEKIHERYYRAMKLFPRLLDLCDELYVYDNSYERDVGEPEMILSLQYGEIKFKPNAMWSMDNIEKLCNGTYNGEE